MARMKFPATVPPRGWAYIQADTKLKITGESLSDLAAKVVAHRKYKGLPGADKETATLDIERQICSRLSKRDCTAEGLEDEWKPVSDNPNVRLGTVMAVSKVLFDVVALGKLAPKDQAAQRGEVCKGCPLNNAMTGCKCSIFYKTINKFIPLERRDPELGVCGACSCSLNAKVNIPIEAIQKADTGRNIEYHANCWVRNEIANADV